MSIDYARHVSPEAAQRPGADANDTASELVFEFRSVAHQTAAEAGSPGAARSLDQLEGVRRRVWSNIRRSLGQRDIALHALCLLVLVCFVLLDVKSPGASLLAIGMLYLLRAGRAPSKTLA